MRPTVCALALLVVWSLLHPPDALGVGVRLPTREAFEKASIVCWVDSVVYHPPAEPTRQRPWTRAEYSARVTHVWKGEVGRRIRLGMSLRRGLQLWSCSPCGDAPLTVGQPNLVFADSASNDSLPSAWGGVTLPRDQALWLLYELAREQPAPRVLVQGVAPPPSVSIRSIARAIAADDSASAAAVPATWYLPDSSGFFTAALLTRLGQVTDRDERQAVAWALISLAERKDKGAKRAAEALFDSSDPQVRAAIVAACQSSKLFHGEVKRALTKDPSPDVRAEAERVVARWTRATSK